MHEYKAKLLEGIAALTVPEAWLWGTAGIFGLMMIATYLIFGVDRRRINRESVWAKPLKFEISLMIHFVTLAVIAGRMSIEFRSSHWLQITATFAAAAALFEITYIFWRASRVEASHFNIASQISGLMYGLMAIGAMIITAAASVVAVLVLLDNGFSGGPGLRWGAVLGLSAGTILTFITAFAMGGAMSHHVGVESVDAPRMPITGWSMTVGDRRPAHFVATHMMQIVPIFGLFADRMLPAELTLPATIAAAGLLCYVTLVFFRHGNRGIPLVKCRTKRANPV
jgi:hypothetical protein